MMYTHDSGRRTFLKSTIAAVPLEHAPLESDALAENPFRGDGAKSSGHPGLIIREKEPVNLEFLFPALDEPVTAINRFFIRTHFPMPTIEAKDWKLTIDGEVERPVSLNYDELIEMKAKTAPMLLECAGNGRAHLVPKAKGLLWESGAVGAAEWTGVPLSAVLEMAGVKKNAVEVVLQGADSGEITEEPQSPGAIAFERSLPLAKAMKPEVILAYQMNGRELTREHGFPVRAVVGGWYGMASVKWLTRLTVTSVPFHGFWQTLEYAYWQRNRGRPTLTPVTEIQVKSQIARPALSEVVPAGKPYLVVGAAWGGESAIAKVEIGVGAGKSWAEAKLIGEAVPFSWRLWEYSWDVPKAAGRYKLTARATDAQGRIQADRHDNDRRNYMINFAVPVEVDVQ